MLVFTICCGVTLLLLLIPRRTSPPKTKGDISSLEALEPRIAPAALNASFSGGVLTIAGDPVDDDIEIFQSSGSIEVFDGAVSIGVFENVRSITVKIQGGSDVFANLADNGIRGNLKVTVSGESILTIAAGSRIGGKVSFIGDVTAQILELGANADIAKSLSFNGKSGADSVVIGPGVSIGKNATFTAVETGTFDVTATIGGNLQFKNASVVLPVSIGTQGPSIGGLNVAGKVSYLGGSADDSVFLHGTIGGSVLFKDKGGNNSFGLSGTSTVSGSVNVVTGNGNDMFAFQGGRVDGNLTLKLGSGNNTFNYGIASSVTVGGNLHVTAGEGSDAIRVLSAGLSVGKNITMNLGDGNNRIQVSVAMTGGKIVVNTGSGEDVVVLEGLAPGSDVRINLGAGADELLGSVLSNTKSGIYNGGEGIDRFSVDTLRGNPLQIISFEDFT